MPIVATFRYFVCLMTHSAKGCIGWLVDQPVRTIHFAGLRCVMSGAAMLCGSIFAITAFHTIRCTIKVIGRSAASHALRGLVTAMANGRGVGSDLIKWNAGFTH